MSCVRSARASEMNSSGVSPPWHGGHLGAGKFFVPPCALEKVSSIPGVYSLDAGSTCPAGTAQNGPTCCRMFPGVKNQPWLRITGLNSRRFLISGASAPWGEADRQILEKIWPENDQCMLHQRRGDETCYQGAPSGWVGREGGPEVLT